MTIDEAAKRLSDRYRRAIPRREQALSIHVFAIEFADELVGMNLKELAARASIPTTYATELRKGINLAKYVELRK